MEENLSAALIALKVLLEDPSVPKNVRIKLQGTALALENTVGPVALKVCKAREDLEQISENLNLQSFVRTQIFNVVSLLEVVRP